MRVVPEESFHEMSRAYHVPVERLAVKLLDLPLPTLRRFTFQVAPLPVLLTPAE
jgi:hypothetical protein